MKSDTTTITRHHLMHDRLAIRYSDTVFYMEQNNDGHNTSVALSNIDEAEALAQLILNWVKVQRKQRRP